MLLRCRRSQNPDTSQTLYHIPTSSTSRDSSSAKAAACLPWSDVENPGTLREACLLLHVLGRAHDTEIGVSNVDKRKAGKSWMLGRLLIARSRVSKPCHNTASRLHPIEREVHPCNLSCSTKRGRSLNNFHNNDRLGRYR